MGFEESFSCIREAAIDLGACIHLNRGLVAVTSSFLFGKECALDGIAMAF